MPSKSRKRPKGKAPKENQGYSLWNPPPGWLDRDPFDGKRSLVDPSLTPEQISEAMKEAQNSPRMRAFTATMTPEQWMQPVCNPAGVIPVRSKPSEEWVAGFREGRASGAMSERIRIARMAYAEGNPIAEKLDPTGFFHPKNDPEADDE